MPYAVGLTLAVTTFGIIALTVTFAALPQPRTIYIAMWINDAAVIAWAAYLAWSKTT